MMHDGWRARLTGFMAECLSAFIFAPIWIGTGLVNRQTFGFFLTRWLVMLGLKVMVVYVFLLAYRFPIIAGGVLYGLGVLSIIILAIATVREWYAVRNEHTEG